MIPRGKNTIRLAVFPQIRPWARPHPRMVKLVSSTRSVVQLLVLEKVSSTSTSASEPTSVLHSSPPLHSEPLTLSSTTHSSTREPGADPGLLAVLPVSQATTSSANSKACYIPEGLLVALAALDLGVVFTTHHRFLLARTSRTQETAAFILVSILPLPPQRSVTANGHLNR